METRRRRTIASNLRFAGDFVVAITLPQLSHKKKDLTKRAAQHGLQIHPETHEYHDEPWKAQQIPLKQISVDIVEMNIGILLRDGNMKYLGQSINFQQPGQTELPRHVKCA